MTAKVIDGKQIAADLRASTKEEVEKFIAQYGKKPTLAVVLVGEDPASQVYVSTKTKMAKEIGMNVEDHLLEKTVQEEELLKVIDQLNNNDEVNMNILENITDGIGVSVSYKDGSVWTKWFTFDKLKTAENYFNKMKYKTPDVIKVDSVIKRIIF